MNIIESTGWLTDRTSELEQAQGKLASLELQLEQADQAFGKTNGCVDEFVRCRDTVEHLRHQIAQCRQSIATCESNVDCARAGLARVQKQVAVDEIQAARASRLGKEVSP